MRILLTNDDGITHPGLAAMLDALEDRHGEFGGPLLDRSPGATTRAPRAAVFPVAPLTVQSATSHGVTFHTPLMVSTETIHEPEGVRPASVGLAVDGRPADCVKLAISQLWPARFGADSRPDLVVSGINSGANVGINVIYSGTVAAAIEAAFLGVPSIAVSLHIGAGKPLYSVAARFARRVIERILSSGPPRPHECLSINIPITESDGPMPEVVACPMNTHALVDSYEARTSPSARTYYWASGHGLNFHATDAGTDVAELFNKRITVTPLRYDLTRHEELERWAKLLAATAAPATP